MTTLRVPSATNVEHTMTMHTTSLPFQVNGTNGLNNQSQNMRGNAVLNNDGVNFGATLQRQVEQRQLEQRQAQAQAQPAPQMQPQPAQPQAVAKPQAQANKPAANEAKAPAREAAREPAKDTAKTDSTEKADTAQASTDTKATADSGEGEEAAQGDAKAADSVTDMLAMLASLSQPQAAAKATPALDTGAAGGAQAGQKGKLGLESEPAIKLDTNALAAAADGQDKAAQGIDLRGMELGKAGEQAAKLQADAGQFAAKLHDSTAALKETAAPETFTSLVAQTNALQNAQAAGAVPTDRLSARVGTPAWDNQVGQKVIWMVGGEEQSATLELNPPDLGPVQVVLNVSNDMASVTFSSQQLEVRQALENSLPRLREMMSESGIALGNASVNAGNEGNGQQNQPGSGRSGGGGSGNGGGDSAVAEVTPRQRTSILGGAGAVDTFA